MKDIDARPIKKIAEAKARKKRKVSSQYHTFLTTVKAVYTEP